MCVCHQSELEHSSSSMGKEEKEEKEAQGSLGEAITLFLVNFVYSQLKISLHGNHSMIIKICLLYFIEVFLHI